MSINGNHHISSLKVHLIFIIKHRKKLILPSIKKILHQSFNKTCENLNCKLIECNGEMDHIHLLIEYPTTTISITSLVQQLKGASSYKIRKFPSVHTYRTKCFWSSSYYAASCGGASLEKIKQYIENQGRLISLG